MDWALVGSLVTMVGALVVAFLQNRAAKVAKATEGQATEVAIAARRAAEESAEKAKDIVDITTAIIKGVEKGSKMNPALNGVKGFIRGAAADAGVQEKLQVLVKKYT